MCARTSPAPHISIRSTPSSSWRQLPDCRCLPSSGDSGSADCKPFTTSTAATVDYPASDPAVTGVGGTTLKTSQTAPNRETTWGGPSATSGGGGGVSHHFAMEDWQTGTGVVGPDSSPTPCGQTITNCREVPDIALDGNPNTGYVVKVTNGGTSVWGQVGGTSAAAPLMAAITAVANSASVAAGGQRLGPANEFLYAHPEIFHDVTLGTNGIAGADHAYSAGVGYDMASGLGSPDGVKFAQALIDATVPTGLDTVTLTAASSEHHARARIARDALRHAHRHDHSRSALRPAGDRHRHATPPTASRCTSPGLPPPARRAPGPPRSPRLWWARGSRWKAGYAGETGIAAAQSGDARADGAADPDHRLQPDLERHQILGQARQDDLDRRQGQPGDGRRHADRPGEAQAAARPGRRSARRRPSPPTAPTACRSRSPRPRSSRCGSRMPARPPARGSRPPLPAGCSLSPRLECAGGRSPTGRRSRSLPGRSRPPVHRARAQALAGVRRLPARARPAAVRRRR